MRLTEDERRACAGVSDTLDGLSSLWFSTKTHPANEDPGSALHCRGLFFERERGNVAMSQRYMGRMGSVRAGTDPRQYPHAYRRSRRGLVIAA
jgi:hypothetical protein